MNDACYCDFDAPTVYRAAQRVARKSHRCDECRRPILAGETYENVFAIWENSPQTARTCSRCLAIRAYVRAHLPCFCFMHHSLLDDALEAMREYARQVPGMGMEFGRLYVRATRPQRAAE